MQTRKLCQRLPQSEMLTSFWPKLNTLKLDTRGFREFRSQMQAISKAFHSGPEMAPNALSFGWDMNPMSLFWFTELLFQMFLGALVLKGNKDGCSAILNHIKDRNPLNYDHANLHPPKRANYMSGGHSVIRNNCYYTFIYSFCATPLNYHGYNLKKRFCQTFI